MAALGCADVLLALDRRDFGRLMGQTVYGLRVRTPGGLLREEREAGRDWVTAGGVRTLVYLRKTKR